MSQHPDTIHLRDYILSRDIGAFQSERGQTQRLRFNLTVELAHPVSDADDHVDRILSYDALTDAIAVALADQRYNLLETLAEKIAAEVLAHPRAACIDVTVEKLDRIPGALGVSIRRAAGRVDVAPNAAKPVILFCATDTRLAAPPVGAAIVVAGDPQTAPITEGADRMIALLALDQAAWALSVELGLDVVGSRTELDWAIASARPVIWAPAQICADVAELPADPVALTLWLASRVKASGITVALRDGAQIPPSFAAAPLGVSRYRG